MEETLQNPETGDGKKPSSRTIALSALVAVAVVASFWLVFEPFHKGRGRLQNANLPMNATEQEYLKKIEIGNIALSRAENFLHQEVTILSGEVANGGSEPVAVLRVTTEFADDLNQIILRETRDVLASTDAALAPGERRSFEISFDHVPNSWNMQQPSVRIAYVQLSSRK
jgi:hypothetical protein